MKNGMFYSLVVKDSSWINILREAAEKSKTKDPQKVKLAQKAWYNVDGTSGEKIHEAAKNELLSLCSI